MNNKDVSVGNANTNVAHDSDKCMSDEQAKIALAIINQPDSRFSSMGENEQSIAQVIAMYNLMKECSEKGVSGFSDHFEPHVCLVKKRALQNQSRRRTIKRRNKKTGKTEFLSRVVSCDTEINGDGTPTTLETFVAKSSASTETMEELERQHEIQALFSKVKAKVVDLPIDGHSKATFAFYMAGHTYESIARQVYGYNNPGTKKIYTNKVSCVIHSIFMKLRDAYGNEAKTILRPVRHVYERYT